jgi:Mn-dependent DtxR family transcriptional regulator
MRADRLLVSRQNSFAGLSCQGSSSRSPPTHAELARRVSTQDESVTLKLGELARLGLVERRDDGLLITNLSELERLMRDVTGE